MVRFGTITQDDPEQGTDYTLVRGGSAWITVGKLSVYIHQRIDEEPTLFVDIYEHGKEMEDPIQSLVVSL